MDFNVETTNLDGVYKVYLEKYFDDRGKIVNLLDYHPNGEKYLLNKLTISKKNVLRGLHGDAINDKLIYCIRGKFKLIVVNYDQNHAQFLQKSYFDMDEQSDFAVFVPKGFLNGHYNLEDNTYFYYKWSSGYVSADQQISVNWNSPSLALDWNLTDSQPHLSDRDKNAKLI